MRSAVLAVVLVVMTTALGWTDDDLAREMELDIQIQELSKDVLDFARDEAWKAYRQTSHNVRMAEAHAEHLRVIQNENPEYRKAQSELFGAKAEVEAKRFIYDLAHRSIRRLRRHQLNSGPGRKLHALYEQHAQGLTAALERLENAERVFRPLEQQQEKEMARVKAVVESLREEQADLINRFARKVYDREMQRRLKAMEIEVDKRIREKVRRSFKKWEA